MATKPLSNGKLTGSSSSVLRIGSCVKGGCVEIQWIVWQPGPRLSRVGLNALHRMSVSRVLPRNIEAVHTRRRRSRRVTARGIVEDPAPCARCTAEPSPYNVTRRPSTAVRQVSLRSQIGHKFPKEGFFPPISWFHCHNCNYSRLCTVMSNV